MVDMVNEVMHKRRQQLIDKFVREPGPEDPVFFDPYSDNPQVISELRIPNADRMRRIVVDGPYACLMDEFDGVYVVDVSNPFFPQYAQLLELFDPTSIATDNNRLYVTDQGNGLVIYTR